MDHKLKFVGFMEDHAFHIIRQKLLQSFIDNKIGKNNILLKKLMWNHANLKWYDFHRINNYSR